MHIGKKIESVLHEQGRTVTWLAMRLNFTRANIYKIFGREGIDTNLLLRISTELNHNFFNDLSSECSKRIEPLI